ncbi:Aminopeptidase N [Pseudolycoriella hygida]|uniref:Aminopeptidase N n=1 Tax=Pseudolycoriella hygida TaxID=35572 RepID=A0A9Q0MIF5_9DIPT|nr:Aminopeptidase N [Pseudolycoriella hygida]
MEYDNQLFAESKSRSMSHYTDDPSEVNSLFDEVVYGKAGAVLRMFMHAFTENSFRKGLKYYLTDNAYDSVTEEDLFDGLKLAVKEDGTLDENLSVHEIFSSWSNQAGLPLLTVNRNYSDNTIQITQESCVDKSSKHASWWIPYNFDTANNIEQNKTTPDGWLAKGVQSMVIRPTEQKSWSTNDWVIFNRQQTGYYRVLYDERNYQMILDDYKSGRIEKIHSLNRAQLMDDLGYFARSGRLPYSLFFEFFKQIAHGTDKATITGSNGKITDLLNFEKS